MNEHKSMLIVGWLVADELFLTELVLQAKLLGFEVDTFLLQDGTFPKKNTSITIGKKYDVIVASGLGAEQWWVDALNRHNTPVVYNNWLQREVGRGLGLNVRHVEIIGGNVANVLRGAQQLTA